MRSKRTSDESWAINFLLSHLEKNESGWKEDDTITDKPDLVLENTDGHRTACELSTVSIREWYQWKNDPRMKLDTDQLDSFILPREPNIWLEVIINSKNPKVDTYRTNSNSTEVWLIAHSTQMEPYDFFVLDKEYDLPLLQSAATSVAHEFSRIYVISSTAGIAQVFPPESGIGPPPKLGPGVLKQLEVRSMKKNASGGGRIPVAIGSEFKPDREIILQPLGDYVTK